MYRCFSCLLILTSVALYTCAPQTSADLIIHNARIYTVDPENPWSEAIAIQDGRIAAVGSDEDMRTWTGSSTRLVDAQGHFTMPGFIEGHGHFSSLGSSLQNLNFLDSRSWDEIVRAVAQKASQSEEGVWVTGRGWHQEKWTDTLLNTVHGYPYHDALSRVAPGNPVMLEHASGHALIANKRAMELAGVTAETANPEGGRIVRDNRGNAIGVFEDNAMALIESAHQEYIATLSEDALAKKWEEGISLAEQECLSKGITTFHDAGISLHEFARYEEMALAGALDLRLYTMLRHTYPYLRDRLEGFPKIGIGGGLLTGRAVKVSIDGALGSYSAWLLEPYLDIPEYSGLNTSRLDDLGKTAALCRDQGMQLCVHAIGDRANREVLNVFAQQYSEHSDPQDLRWRIEHAQHLHPQDIPRFSELGVIASMQAIHCTSDMPFVIKRLGEKRAREGAYAWSSLLETGAIVTNGTDTPVEDVDPIASFYASVTRRRADTGEAFFPEQCMTREEAVYSYTMANAYAAFEEDLKGSIETGKLADLVILSNDLLACADSAILSTRVLMTIVGGEIKYSVLSPDGE